MESGAMQKLPYPKAVGFIIANEFCERFSYYGMRTILSNYLKNKLKFNENGATVVFHTFTMFAYFFPLFGAMIADGWLGKYRTILYLSIIYTVGSILISIAAIPINMPTLLLTIVALSLIAVGTGGIKPCVAAFGGDQFKLPEQQRQLATFFSLFYFSINSGSLISTFLTPVLKDVYCFGESDCYSLAFGIPGILMVVSLVVFVLGKKLYAVKRPSGNIYSKVAACIYRGVTKSCKSRSRREHWLDNADDKYDTNFIEDVKALLRVLVLFLPLPVFWALYDQQGSRWNFQASRTKREIGSLTIKPEHMQVVNPLLILAFIPLFETVIYPFMTKFKLIRKPLHKMIWGGVLASSAFFVSGVVELCLLPSYGTPVTNGIAQLRIYNSENCSLKLSLENVTDNITIEPFSEYENLEIESKTLTDLPYNLSSDDFACKNLHDGVFHLKEATANSFLLRENEMIYFVDNNNKTSYGTVIRFLSNMKNNYEILLRSTDKSYEPMHIQSDDMTEKEIENGYYDVIINSETIFKNYFFELGGVYSVILYENEENDIVANAIIITPPNNVHILWLFPQYILITMGEVMFSVTGLEFSFTQAPVTMKSVLQSVWLLTVTLGNIIVVLVVESKVLDAQWKEFFLFAGLMLLDMMIFAVLAFRYQYVDKSSNLEESMPETASFNKQQL